MKIGMVISASIVLILCLAFYFKFQPKPADSPTDATSAEYLAKQTLSGGLSDFGFKPGTGGSAEQLLSVIDQNKNTIRAGGNDENKLAPAKAVVDALTQAAGADLGAGFLDNLIPAKQFDSDQASQAMMVLRRSVSLHITRHIEEAEFEQARQIALAYLAFGRQAFEKNVRLKARQSGLASMKGALADLGRINASAEMDGEISRDKLFELNKDTMAHLDAIKKLEDVWNAKLKSNETVSQANGIPNIGDLIRMAKEDQDPTFRIYAALRLGYALYERGDPGNQKAINQALDDLEQSSEAAVAAAAKAGRSIKDADEYHQLRK